MLDIISSTQANLDPACIVCNATKDLTACQGCDLVHVCKNHDALEVFDDHSTSCQRFILSRCSLDHCAELFQKAYNQNPAEVDFDSSFFLHHFKRQQCSVDLDLNVEATEPYRAYCQARWEHYLALLRLRSGPASELASREASDMRRQGIGGCPRVDAMMLCFSLRRNCDKLCYDLLVTHELQRLWSREASSICGVFSDAAVTQQLSLQPPDIFDAPYIRDEWQEPEMLSIQLLLKSRALSNLRSIQAAHTVCGNLPLELALYVVELIASELVCGNLEVRRRIRGFEDLKPFVVILEGHIQLLLDRIGEPRG